MDFSAKPYAELTWKRQPQQSVMPVFLPYMGCRARCVFCAQDAQTGVSRIADATELGRRLERCRSDLIEARARGRACRELAFYGGTFTQLPDSLWRICLHFAREVADAGLIDGWRCSTRPDALPSRRLAEMAGAGCRLVELGIQSFQDYPLACARRGYNRKIALAAGARVASAGMAFCVHLMPGLPGATPEDFLMDVATALDAGCACLRFHPCLVLGGTELARIWAAGGFKPWDMEPTLEILARGWLLARARERPVIRMGLAPEPDLLDAVVAGPWHPAMGSRVMGRALLLTMRKIAAGLQPQEKNLLVRIPRHAQGYLRGWRGELATAWERLGINVKNIAYWDGDRLQIFFNK